MTSQVVTIRTPDDFHVHLRENNLLHSVVPYTASVFKRALVMPNTKQPILTAKDARTYWDSITRAVTQKVSPNKGFSFQPLLTIKLTPATTPSIIHDAKAAGVLAAKLYPAGATTNSDDGWSPYEMYHTYRGVLRAMEESGLVLCVHAELPGAPTLDREENFFRHIEPMFSHFPQLKIVIEHVSSGAGVSWVLKAPPTVAATITAHHLVLTLDDVIGHKINPHHFCKPVPKSFHDLHTLQLAALAQPKFFFGSDSAPHYRTQKEGSQGAAGIFSAPVALPVLASVFEALGGTSTQIWSERLEEFTSKRGAEFYGLPLNTGKITLKQVPWIVPKTCGGIVPLRAGSTLDWQITPNSHDEG